MPSDVIVPRASLIAVAAFGLLLSGCMDTAHTVGAGTTENTFALALANATASAPLASSARAASGAPGSASAARAQAQYFPGEMPDIQSARAEPGAANQVADLTGSVVPTSGGFQLNFESADVSSVARAILGDVLKVNYSVDPRVTGQINLTSSRPVLRRNILPLLERSLGAIGASLVKDPEFYRIVPAADTGGLGNVDYEGASEGFGTTVIPAKYVPAPTIARMLESLGTRAGSVRVDATTNMVMVQGSAVERRSAKDAADMIDVDWLRSKSVAVLPVTNSSPDTVISEINRILDTGEGGLSQNVVQLQPMARLNAVLAVSRRKDAIDLVTKWVTRLDRADYAASGLKVYKLQYAQAKSVAATLNQMFAQGGLDTNDGDSAELDPLAGGKPALERSPNGSAGTVGASNTGAPSPFGALKASFSEPVKEARSAQPQLASVGGLAAGAGKRLRVSADTSSNSVLINAPIRDYRLIEQAIRQLDRAPVQVNIEATIAEVTLTRDLQYGVQAFLQSGKFSSSLGKGIPLLQSHPGLNLLIGAASNPRILLNALTSVTEVKILSSPSLVVLDRQAAVLQVGDQVPILTRSASSVENPLAPVVNSVEYKDTGIILNVLPRVNSNGVVTLDIEQQISSVSNQDQTLTPTVSQRRVRSSIAINNGQTAMLAGLISEKATKGKDGIPVLSNIKFIGDLLASNTDGGQRTELLIFIKPKIISNGADAAQVTDEFRSRMLSLRRP